MSTLKVDTIQNTNAVEMYLCKAWVNFDGTQAAADMIRDSGNVSSITDVATGRYEVNFTNALEDTNYVCVTGVNFNTISGGSGNYNRSAVVNAATTSKAYLNTYYIGTSSNVVLNDVPVIQLAVFR